MAFRGEYNLIMVVVVVLIVGVNMGVFKTPGHMNFQTTDMDEAWRRWEQQFRTYFTEWETTKKIKNVQVAILLHAVGPEAQEIHSHFSLATGDAKDNHKTIWMHLGLSVNQGKTLYLNNTGSGAGTKPRVRQ